MLRQMFEYPVKGIFNPGIIIPRATPPIKADTILSRYLPHIQVFSDISFGVGVLLIVLFIAKENNRNFSVRQN